MRWTSRNFGLHPADPAYDSDYDEEADYEAFLAAEEVRAESMREEALIAAEEDRN